MTAGIHPSKAFLRDVQEAVAFLEGSHLTAGLAARLHDQLREIEQARREHGNALRKRIQSAGKDYFAAYRKKTKEAKAARSPADIVNLTIARMRVPPKPVKSRHHHGIEAA